MSYTVASHQGSSRYFSFTLGELSCQLATMACSNKAGQSDTSILSWWCQTGVRPVVMVYQAGQADLGFPPQFHSIYLFAPEKSLKG